MIGPDTYSAVKGATVSQMGQFSLKGLSSAYVQGLGAISKTTPCTRPASRAGKKRDLTRGRHSEVLVRQPEGKRFLLRQMAFR